MEDLKARFYSLSATLLQLNTPITSMTAPEYTMFETLSNWNAAQEISRKKLAEGHLQRRQNEVDEESVLLSELQRIMVNQAAVDNDRDVRPMFLQLTCSPRKISFLYPETTLDFMCSTTG